MNVPGYRVIRELGRGGMATVYLALQESLQRHVALKVMSADLARDSDFRGRFLREAQIVARLAHPHIVTVHDFGSSGDVFFLSMEYLPGGTLKEQIDSGLSPARAIEILVPVAKALAHAHRQGVVHRDIKPQNILLRDSGVPVLTDFGIARLLSSDTQLTATGFAIGSPRYMSPEQVLGQAVDGRSDLFSLGIVLYEMLTGAVPWVDTDHPITVALKLCSEPIPPLPAALRQFEGVLQRLVAKSPADRYPDAEAFATEMLALERARPDDVTVLLAPARPVDGGPEEPPVGRHPRLRRALLGVAGLVAAVGLGWGLYLAGIGHAPAPVERVPGTSDVPATDAERPIASRYERLAIEHLRDRQFEQSLELIGTGLRAVPDHAGLLALRDQVLAAQTAHARTAEVMASVRQAMAAGDLEQAMALVTSGLRDLPHDKEVVALQAEIESKLRVRQEVAGLLASAREKQNAAAIAEAMQLVDQAQRLDSGDATITALRKELVAQEQVSDLLAQARQEQQSGRFQDALESVRAGLQLAPGQAELHNLEKRLVAALATQDRLASLLMQCEGHLRAGRLMTGTPATAFDCYREVLALEPANAGALAGLARIADRYVTLVGEAVSAGNLTVAQSHLDRLHTVAPQHAEYLALQKRLEQAEEEARQAGAAKERKLANRPLEATGQGNRRPVGSNRLQCRNLLLKLQLGEPLASTDKKFLQEECK